MGFSDKTQNQCINEIRITFSYITKNTRITASKTVHSQTCILQITVYKGKPHFPFMNSGLVAAI
jgi:hypothetical protein